MSCSKLIVDKSNISFIQNNSNIEFNMPLIKEPSIPNNVVKITDFGAKNGGFELNTKAFENAIAALEKKVEVKLLSRQEYGLRGL
ncbi:hypothetical protein FUMI01_12650 [Flavobacterium sp. UMI-01]|nr:hypothetical protein FUMI01_12650 [Flavobacterium sp. UMI-01]